MGKGKLLQWLDGNVRGELVGRDERMNHIILWEIQAKNARRGGESKMYLMRESCLKLQ